MDPSALLLSHDEMYALIELVKKAHRTRGVPLRRVWEEIEVFAKTMKGDE